MTLRWVTWVGGLAAVVAAGAIPTLGCADQDGLLRDPGRASAPSGRRRIRGGNPNAAQGDPAKVARAIADEPNPPLRLLLGSDAVFMADVVANARAQEDAAWKEVSLSTDADGIPTFTETPVAQYLMSQQPPTTRPRAR
jgi:hypothetical protein